MSFLAHTGIHTDCPLKQPSSTHYSDISSTPEATYDTATIHVSRTELPTHRGRLLLGKEGLLVSRSDARDAPRADRVRSCTPAAISRVEVIDAGAPRNAGRRPVVCGHELGCRVVEPVDALAQVGLRGAQGRQSGGTLRHGHIGLFLSIAVWCPASRGRRGQVCDRSRAVRHGGPSSRSRRTARHGLGIDK